MDCNLRKSSSSVRRKGFCLIASKPIRDERGQGTIEAAFAIPVLFLLMLLLVQPGILLYDYIVMRSAAVETCRLAATTDSGALAGCVEFAKHRLSSVPQHDFFHVHEGSCTWEVQVDGGEQAGCSEVRISNQARPLPLFDISLKLLGLVNASGNLELKVMCSSLNQPQWAGSAEGGVPSGWVEAW